MEAASFWLSVAAILITAIFAVRQERLSRKVAKIDEDRRSDEVAARLVADMTADFESRPRRGSAVAEEHFLVILNRGPARATDVDVDCSEADMLMKQDMGFPIALDPGQRFPIPAVMVYGGPPFFDVMLRWTDERGPQENTLRLATP